jgi:hypothetical protein
VGIGVSVLLSLLTLTVFAQLGGSGPEAQVRGFIEAAKKGDVESARAFVTDLSDPSAAEVLWLRTREISVLPYRIVKYEVVPPQAFVLVTFITPNGLAINQVFVLQKNRHKWRINPYSTVNLVRSGV